MKIYLIRHAESEDNVFERTSISPISRAAYNTWLLSSSQTMLSPRGCEQTIALTERFRGVHVDRLFTSPWPRAYHTAEVLGATLSLIPEPYAGLREVLPAMLSDRGSPAPLQRLFSRSYLRMWLPGAHPETWIASARRVHAMWRELTRQPADTIAVVTHGWVIGILCLTLTPSIAWHVVTRDLSNCGVSLIVSRCERLEVIS